MRPSDRFTPFAFGMVGTVAGAVGVLALAYYGNLTDVPTSEQPVSQASLQEVRLGSKKTEAARASRFAHVPLKPLPLTSLHPDEQLRPAESLDTFAAPRPWSTKTRTEATATPNDQRLASLSPQRPIRTNPTTRTRLRRYTLKERLAEISPSATRRIAEKFEAASVVWPPADIGLVAIKDEKRLELFARPEGGAWKFVHRYPVLAASGVAGPKLRQGDKQVPEGVYRITFLNPNSRFHVSLRVNYPNTFDRKMAAKDGRKNLGGDIMIHGKNVSAGCLAVGDQAAEELFVLAANVGLQNIKLIIAPTDFRQHGLPTFQPKQPDWLPKLYTEIASAMSEFRAPPRTGLLSLLGLSGAGDNKGEGKMPYSFER